MGVSADLGPTAWRRMARSRGYVSTSFCCSPCYYLPEMKELPTHTRASDAPPGRRSSAWTLARRCAALALLGVIGFHSTTTSEPLLDRVYDAVHELKWKSTMLSKNPHERALQLMDRQPVIGQSLPSRFESRKRPADSVRRDRVQTDTSTLKS